MDYIHSMQMKPKPPTRTRPAATPSAPSTRHAAADEAASSGALRRRGRPRLDEGPVLDRQRLIQTLLDITRQEGLQALNMRRIASELGVSPRLLYRHARNKVEMIDMLTDAILADHLPDLSSPDWETRLRNIAYAVHQAYASFPGMAAEILARSASKIDQPHAVAVRQAVLDATAQAGLNREQSEITLIQFSVIVMGSLVLAEGIQGDKGKLVIRRARVEKSLALALELLLYGIRNLGERARSAGGTPSAGRGSRSRAKLSKPG